MKQAKIDQIRAEKDLENLSEMMDNRMKTYAGFLYEQQHFDTFSHTPEEREAFFEKTWEMVSSHPPIDRNSTHTQQAT